MNVLLPRPLACATTLTAFVHQQAIPDTRRLRHASQLTYLTYDDPNCFSIHVLLRPRFPSPRRARVRLITARARDAFIRPPPIHTTFP